MQIGQIYFLDVFFEGQFRGYGPSVALAVETKPFERVDPMARLFPKVTKCTIHTFGSSGSPQTLDALCILPLNVVNEKIFVFLWFWLVFLTAISALALFYRYNFQVSPWWDYVSGFFRNFLRFSYFWILRRITKYQK